jgi:uncharacterized protein
MSMPKVTMTAINLPVSDLKASRTFYEALGFTFNPQFSDDTAACLVLNDTAIAMLLTHKKFQGFSGAPIPDSKITTGVMTALALENREAVDELTKAALAAGGTEPRPANDYGFMYQRTIADPDGNRWEPFYMDMSKIPQT